MLAGGVPHIENEATTVCVERHGVNLDTNGGDVLLLELTCQVTLDECGLADTTISDQEALELRDL